MTERRRIAWRGLETPPGWRIREIRGTRAMVERPDGSVIDWSTRRHRKGLAPPTPGARGRRHLMRGASASSWWLGGLFMVGSFCFALGSLPLFFDAVAAEIVAWVFFAGSIFFTSAGYLQFREAVAAPQTIDPEGPRRRGWRSLIGWRAHSLGWWAAAVQFIGTLLFNVSTFAATRDDLTSDQERHLIWAPDVWGSVCFLIASILAYVEVCPQIWRRPRGDVGWHIALLNLVGSIAFGLSAIGARYLPTTGEVANIALVNLGTFAGAVCFFVGAALLPVESATSRSPDAARTGVTAP